MCRDGGDVCDGGYTAGAADVRGGGFDETNTNWRRLVEN